MPFLIGLGIILAIIGVNEVYLYIKEKKSKETEELPEVEMVSGNTVEPLVAERSSCLNLSDLIAEKLKQKQNIFGLPLTLCETDENGRLVTVDREDNIYIVETALRPEYDDWYLQVAADMAVEKGRIAGKKAKERKVYAIVCTQQPSESLIAAAERGENIRIFSFDVVFQNIV